MYFVLFDEYLVNNKILESFFCEFFLLWLSYIIEKINIWYGFGKGFLVVYVLLSYCMFCLVRIWFDEVFWFFDNYIFFCIVLINNDGVVKIIGC